MQEGQEGPASESSAPTSIGRRERDAGSSLPAAGTVARVRTSATGWSRRRTLLAIGSAVGGTGLIVIGMVTSGAGGPMAVADGPVTTYADRVDARPGTTAPAGERQSVASSDDAADADERDPSDTTRPDADSPGRVSDSSTSGATTPGASSPSTGDPGSSQPGSDGTGTTPGGSAPSPTPSTPGTTNPGTTNPGTTNPGTTTPGTTNPGTTNPGTTNPGTTNPGTTNPGTTPTTPPAPQPLGFAGLQKNFTLNLLGIKVLGGYTLSLTGEPGATASVTYGGRGAGSVTFDAGGRASITFGRALLDIGLTDPLVRVAYSDGTAGSPIEARRDSL